MLQRLDKFLADSNIGTRNEIKHYIHSKQVTVNGQIVRDPASKADYNACVVKFNGNIVKKPEIVVCALNKPAGYVTSTEDPLSPTVMELIPTEYENLGIVPVGRLDKDTEGILLFTNDGELIHKLISPKNDVEKTYYAMFEGICPPDAEELFANGIKLKDGTICKNAKFEKLSETEFRVTITEGMYHQVKRMAAACGMHITYLKRESFAGVECRNLGKGQFVELKNFIFG